MECNRKMFNMLLQISADNNTSILIKNQIINSIHLYILGSKENGKLVS